MVLIRLFESLLKLVAAVALFIGTFLYIWLLYDKEYTKNIVTMKGQEVVNVIKIEDTYTADELELPIYLTPENKEALQKLYLDKEIRLEAYQAHKEPGIYIVIGVNAYNLSEILATSKAQLLKEVNKPIIEEKKMPDYKTKYNKILTKVIKDSTKEGHTFQLNVQVPPINYDLFGMFNTTKFEELSINNTQLQRIIEAYKCKLITKRRSEYAQITKSH